MLADLCKRFLHRRLLKAVPLDDYPANFVDVVIQLREACDRLGLVHQYYLKEDKVPHKTYEDYYIVSRQASEDQSGEEADQEVSERIYLFDSNGGYEELSVASDIIGAIRNKKTIVKRFYYPEEIQETVSKFFKGG